MRRLVAVIVALTVLFAVAVPTAQAGTAARVALGLASFAVFSQIFAPLLFPPPVYARAYIIEPAPVVTTRTLVYAPPPVVYAPAPLVAVTPAPPIQPSIVRYPHGRYELRGDGIRTAYTWVWVPNPPAPPPPPPPPPLAQ
jgi:hypothetical protein